MAEKRAKIRPCGDFVLVKRLPQEAVSKGGIIIPTDAQRKNERAEVLAVGPGKWNEAGTARIPLTLKPGDVVLVPKYAGAEDMRGALEERQAILHEDQVLGVEERE